MGENAAALHTAVNSVQALGRGFDVNFDTRLLYCKGVGGSRVVEIDDEHARDLWLYDNMVAPNVSRDIINSQETVGRECSGVCSFDEMVEFFNKRASLPEGNPLGSFNAAFSYTGCKHIDSVATKTLCLDGVFVPLAKLQLNKFPLVLQENVKRAIPATWDPPSLASNHQSVQHPPKYIPGSHPGYSRPFLGLGTQSLPSYLLQGSSYPPGLTYEADHGYFNHSQVIGSPSSGPTGVSPSNGATGVYRRY